MAKSCSLRVKSWWGTRIHSARQGIAFTFRSWHSIALFLEYSDRLQLSKIEYTSLAIVNLTVVKLGLADTGSEA